MYQHRSPAQCAIAVQGTGCLIPTHKAPLCTCTRRSIDRLACKYVSEITNAYVLQSARFMGDMVLGMVRVTLQLSLLLQTVPMES